MALNGYVTAEERRSRLVMTSRGYFVVVVRQPSRPWPGVKTVATEYAVFRDGALIGWVYKIRKWGVSGLNSGFKTRKEAIECVIRSSTAVAEAIKAKAEYESRGTQTCPKFDMCQVKEQARTDLTCHDFGCAAAPKGQQ